jgi:hypothetical protein
MYINSKIKSYSIYSIITIVIIDVPPLELKERKCGFDVHTRFDFTIYVHYNELIKTLKVATLGFAMSLIVALHCCIQPRA